MFKRVFSGACASLFFGASVSAMPDGSYLSDSDGYRLSAEVKGDRIKIEVSTRGCLGGGTGQLRQVGDRVWQAYLTEYGETCVVQINDLGHSYYMQEVQGCFVYHGMQCGFTGSLSK